ncbi:MAG: tRNA lysidine(34) synthetase TilS [Rhodobacteraceae bacterium]|nr:MAG: tRNA lysidine(34) synthetase TilS [Paracoccaceae bacterium]
MKISMTCDPQKIAEMEEKYCNEMETISAIEIGLAVSGGGDSLALLLMASKWAKSSNRSLNVVTVDHHLRLESREEAIHVGLIANKLGHPHQILDWKFDCRKGNLQAEASLARKKLISQWAKERSIKTVLLGHTLDDQAENFLMRLARGSGVDGLAGMKSRKRLYGINWSRPLLSFYRKDLRDYLSHKEVNWIDDPSNEDTKYTRVKVRRVLRELQALDINPIVLVETSKRMEKAATVLNDVAVHAGEKYLKLREWGDIEVDRKLFKLTRDETYLRLIAHLIKFISGSIYRPRYQELIRFTSALSVSSFKARTIGGVIARSLSKDILVLRREPSVPSFITDIPSKKFTWDGRWEITVGTNRLGNLEKIGPLGEAGLIQIQKKASTLIPKESLKSAPTLFYKEEVLASPLLNFGKGLTCRLAYKKCDLINSLATD